MVKEARNRRGHGHDRHIGGNPARDGLDRRDRRARQRLLGRSVPAQPPELQDRRRTHAGAADPRARHHQAGGGAGERRGRPARCRTRRGDRRGGRRGDRWKARRSLPPGRLADRLGHPEQHERQRGDRQPGLPDHGSAHGPEDPGSSQRPRQSQPVVQRHLPDRHAHRCRRAVPSPAAAGARASARRARGEVGGLRRDREDRPDPPAGRDAAHPGPGVLRLRDAGRIRDRAREGCAAEALRARPGRHRRRHRAQHQGGLRCPLRGRGRGADRASRSAPQRTSSRPSPPTTRWSKCRARSTPSPRA